MNDDPTYESLMATIEEARRICDAAKERESAARRDATAAENAVIRAEKAFVDWMVEKHPRVADEVARRRHGRVSS